MSIRTPTPSRLVVPEEPAAPTAVRKKTAPRAPPTTRSLVNRYSVLAKQSESSETDADGEATATEVEGPKRGPGKKAAAAKQQQEDKSRARLFKQMLQEVKECTKTVAEQVKVIEQHSQVIMQQHEKIVSLEKAVKELSTSTVEAAELQQTESAELRAVVEKAQVPRALSFSCAAAAAKNIPAGLLPAPSQQAVLSGSPVLRRITPRECIQLKIDVSRATAATNIRDLWMRIETEMRKGGKGADFGVLGAVINPRNPKQFWILSRHVFPSLC